MNDRNKSLWRALGWERERSRSGDWYRTHGIDEGIRTWDQMPDYENDDAAAVGLLEELRQRFPGRIAIWPYKEGYYFEIDGGANCAVDWIPTFREAVVAGAEALLGVTA